MEVIHILFSFIAGIAAGFIAAVTGGAGILSIPALIFLGLPANKAVATSALAIFGMLASALPQYQRAGRIQWRTATRLTPLAVIGGIIGAKALTRVNVNSLSVLVGVLLLIMIPIILLNREKGLTSFRPSIRQTVAGYLVFFLVMVYGGFLGAGAGVFSMYTFIFFFGMTYIEAKASVSIPSSFLSLAALVVFLAHGLVDFELGIPMLVGMYVGGMIGAKAALEKGNAWIRTVFVLVVAASAVKLLFSR